MDEIEAEVATAITGGTRSEGHAIIGFNGDDGPFRVAFPDDQLNALVMLCAKLIGQSAPVPGESAHSQAMKTRWFSVGRYPDGQISIGFEPADGGFLAFQLAPAAATELLEGLGVALGVTRVQTPERPDA